MLTTKPKTTKKEQREKGTNEKKRKYSRNKTYRQE